MHAWARVALHVGVASIVLTVAAASFAADAARPTYSAPVEQAVMNQIAAKGETTFWVLVRGKADLSKAPAIPGWAARGQYVVERLQHTAGTTQGGLRGLLKKQGVPFEPFWIANTIKVTGGAAVVKELAAQPEVEEIVADRVFHVEKPTKGQAEAAVNAVEWGIAKIKADQVWSTYGDRGEGIVIANIDTGVQYNHPALVGKYRGNLGGSFDHNYNWYDPSAICGSPSLVPCDNNNHGTHTMGTMVGDDGAGNQIGVAPGAKWIAAKGCESSSCSSTALLNSGQWILAPTRLDGTGADASKRPNIVNNSWGGGRGDPWYSATVDAWVASGIFPAFSAGNSGSACNTANSPGDYVASYAAGAFDSSDVIASFSSRGTSGFGSEIKPNIAAPGVNVRSSVPTNGYANFSGTSMASPHVAGTVALIWSAAPTLAGNIAQTKQLLDQTAVDTSDLTCGGTAADNNVWGEGKLDAYAAVTAAPRGPSGTLAGQVTETGGTPISGARVEVTGGPTSRWTLTDTSGNYSMPLAVGTYSATASAFGKVPQTYNGVSITNGTTTTRNFSLAAAPNHNISGVVRDAGGNPIANATVTILDTPIAPATTNGLGQYSFSSVPDGPYNLRAQAGRCTSPQTKALNLSGADAVVNFDLSLLSDGFYTCSIQATSYVPGTSTLALTGDDASLNVALPFTFAYYGTPYSSVNVSTNGHVSFTGASTAWTNTGLPSTAAPNAAVYPYWDDLYVDASASVRTATPSADRFVIEWNNVYFFDDSTRRVDAEMVLYQDGRILFQYSGIANDAREQGNSTTVGIENAAGTVGIQYSFNEAAVNTTQAVLFTPATAAPLITTTSLPDGTTGVGYNQTVAATGGTTPYSWITDSGTIPPGLSLTSGSPNATVSGNPTTPGSYTFTLRVTDNGGQFDLQSFTVDVQAPLVITTTSPMPGGTVGAAYSQTLQRTGGKSPFTWSVTLGSLPSGLSLAPATGVISGTPTVSGTSNFTVQVTDSGNPPRIATKALSITIAQGATLTITTASPLPAGVVNKTYQPPSGLQLQATGGTGTYTWTRTGGSLPPGLTLPASGLISGTPSKPGNYTFTVQARDTTLPTPLTATKTVSLKVNKK